MQKYDIQITVTVLAKTESHAEQEVKNFMKNGSRVLDAPNVLDWEFTEFVPCEDDAVTCCC